MKYLIVFQLILFSLYSFAEEGVIVGKTNFSEEMVNSVVSRLKDKDPYGNQTCIVVDKIYPKILEESRVGPDKIYSKEKWFLSGCSGASEIVVIASGKNGLTKIQKIR